MVKANKSLHLKNYPFFKILSAVLIGMALSTADFIDVSSDVGAHPGWTQNCSGSYHGYETFKCAGSTVIPPSEYNHNLGYWSICPQDYFYSCKIMYDATGKEGLKQLSIQGYYNGRDVIYVEIETEVGLIKQFLSGFNWENRAIDLLSIGDPIQKITIQPLFTSLVQFAVIDSIILDDGTTTTTTVPTTSTEPVVSTTGQPGQIMQNCGETVVGNDGLIEYKLDQLYRDAERCAFIIRSFDHSGFVFTLENNGLVEDPALQGAAINIFGFGSNGLQDTVHLGPPNPLNSTYVQGSMVVVVFKTEMLRGSGFRLRYQGVGEPDRSVAFWNDLTFSDVPGSLKYPLTESSYASNTSSLFVISNNHGRVPSLYETLHLEISQIDLDVCDDSCSCDFVQVYAFDSESVLEDFQRVCQAEDLRDFDTRGLFVIFFQTDEIMEKSGFSLDWRIQENFK